MREAHEGQVVLTVVGDDLCAGLLLLTDPAHVDRLERGHAVPGGEHQALLHERPGTQAAA
jgi:hypothetical protein